MIPIAVFIAELLSIQNFVKMNDSYSTCTKKKVHYLFWLPIILFKMRLSQRGYCIRIEMFGQQQYSFLVLIYWYGSYTLVSTYTLVFTNIALYVEIFPDVICNYNQIHEMRRISESICLLGIILASSMNRWWREEVRCSIDYIRALFTQVTLWQVTLWLVQRMPFITFTFRMIWNGTKNWNPK